MIFKKLLSLMDCDSLKYKYEKAIEENKRLLAENASMKRIICSLSDLSADISQNAVELDAAISELLKPNGEVK